MYIDDQHNDPIEILTFCARRRIDEVLGTDHVRRNASLSASARAAEADLIETFERGGRDREQIVTSSALAHFLYHEAIEPVALAIAQTPVATNTLIDEAINGVDPIPGRVDVELARTLNQLCTISKPHLAALPSRIAMTGAFADLVTATDALATAERGVLYGPYQRRQNMVVVWTALADAVAKIDKVPALDPETIKKAVG